VNKSASSKLAAVGKGEGHQPRPRLGHLQPELARDVIGEARGPHLGDRLAAGRQHQIAAGDGDPLALALQLQRKAARPMGEGNELSRQPERGVGAGHLLPQHLDDLGGLVVAEKLPQRLFMPGDAVAADQVDEIPLAIAGERRFAEMRVLRQVIRGLCIEIGEIAPTTARDADLLARGACVVDDQNARSRMGRAHHAGRAGAKDDRLILHLRRLARIAAVGKRIALVRCPFSG
jgi:hypothetical protein